MADASEETRSPEEKDSTGVIYIIPLILMAESMARRLTYNDPIQGAAKHVIYELCRRIEQKEKKSKSIIRWLSDTVLRASKK